MQNVITRLGIFVFFLGTCFYFYDFVLQVAPGVMALSLMDSFHISAAVLGGLSGVYFYSYTCMQIPAGLILDRFGAKTVLPWVIFICALGALIFGMATHVSALAIGRFLMGAGSAFAFLGALFLINRWLPVHQFALFAGITQMVGSLGAVGGQAPLAFMIHHLGWRESMIIFAGMGFILALLCRFYLHETSAQRAFADKHARGQVWSNLTKVLRHQQTWMIGLYSFAIWAPIASFAGLWGVPFLTLGYHMNELTAAAFMSIIWIAIAVACPIAGWISDFTHRRVSILGGLGVLGVIGFLLLIYYPTSSSILIFVELFLIGIAAAGQSLAFAAIQDIHPMQLTGAANGFNNMMIVFGGAVFQPLIGCLMDQHRGTKMADGVASYTLANFQHALWVLPALYLVATLIAFFFVKETFCKPQFSSSERSER